MVENWRDIKGYEGIYQVSDLGNVKRLNYRNTGVDRILKPQKHGRNYNGTHVDLSKDKKQKSYTIHSLVMLAFVGERPEGYDICHIDGDPSNNRLDNLRYDTRKENMIDCCRHGRKIPNGKLTINDALEIRKTFKENSCTQTRKDLAKEFNVSVSCINRVIRRETFDFLNDDGSINESNTQIK